MSSDHTPTRIGSVCFHVSDDVSMTAVASDHERWPDIGSVFIGGLQMAGRADDLRAFAKAIEDGAMEIERQHADAEREVREHYGAMADQSADEAVQV